MSLFIFHIDEREKKGGRIMCAKLLGIGILIGTLLTVGIMEYRKLLDENRKLKTENEDLKRKERVAN